MLIFFVIIFMLSIFVIISLLLFFLKRDTLVWKGWLSLYLFWNLNDSQVEKSCIPCKSLENSNNTNFQSYDLVRRMSDLWVHSLYNGPPKKFYNRHLFGIKIMQNFT
jgi:hypothetical protein